eukprot:CAMPEP_0206034852 /NCGR_PEP_ID=MMETSP1466-20131121/1659_1 /ASSEMBLY_ACC=CAM_ASM_001126 /TAXON_ID=44452 /ORGANISM="Pavlova gyrans, Strain CCMP608" /LENGTH=375 /DNA_ID=CAMNT_0053409177 /DNA_START=45 /DNA_END=1169 /DNA_ORIENTATION=-
MADDEEVQAKAATAITAAAKGRRDRQMVTKRQESAVKIGAAAKGRRARKDAHAQKDAASKIGAVGRGNATRKSLGRNGDTEDVGAVPKEAAVDEEGSTAASKIGAAAKGRADRKKVQERRDAAETITKHSKGHVVRKSLGSQGGEEAGGAVPAGQDAEQPAEPAAENADYVAPDPMPMTFAKPPIMYKFLGLDESGSRRAAKFYSNTYTVNVDGFHETQQTKLIVSIEVQGPLHALTRVEALDANLTSEDWHEIARALVDTPHHKLTTADYGPLFRLTQLVFDHVLAKWRRRTDWLGLAHSQCAAQWCLLEKRTPSQADRRCGRHSVSPERPSPAPPGAAAVALHRSVAPGNLGGGLHRLWRAARLRAPPGPRPS